MNLRMFGIGVTDAIAGEQTKGTVTKVNTCWWLKVNTKAVRTGPMDGSQHHNSQHNSKQFLHGVFHGVFLQRLDLGGR